MYFFQQRIILDSEMNPVSQYTDKESITLLQLHVPSSIYFVSATPVPKAKCNLQVDCPADHFALRIRSGAANVVGPSICFDGQMYVLGKWPVFTCGCRSNPLNLHLFLNSIMAHLKNNVGPGLNIVVINGEVMLLIYPVIYLDILLILL